MQFVGVVSDVLPHRALVLKELLVLVQLSVVDDRPSQGLLAAEKVGWPRSVS